MLCVLKTGLPCNGGSDVHNPIITYRGEKSQNTGYKMFFHISREREHCYLLNLLFGIAYKGSKFPRNINKLPSDYTMSNWIRNSRENLKANHCLTISGLL
jgi:hypothetical protein